MMRGVKGPASVPVRVSPCSSVSGRGAVLGPCGWSHEVAGLRRSESCRWHEQVSVRAVGGADQRAVLGILGHPRFDGGQGVAYQGTHAAWVKWTASAGVTVVSRAARPS